MKAGYYNSAIGDLRNGASIARVWVPNTLVAAVYSATVIQVAAKGTYTLQSIGPYALVVR